MAASATPYGLRPVGLIGGQSFAGSTRMIPIADGYTTAIFNGDVVLLIADGTVEKDTGTVTATPVGVFLGCSYTDVDGQFIQRNNWIANTVATDAVAYVFDDPDGVFQIQADATVAATAVGANAGLIQTAGSTLNGKSAVALDATVATTATLPLRIVGFVDGPDSAVGDAFTDCLVKWNFGMHQYETALGV
jgi:hypothetical protein